MQGVSSLWAHILGPSATSHTVSLPLGRRAPRMNALGLSRRCGGQGQAGARLGPAQVISCQRRETLS